MHVDLIESRRVGGQASVQSGSGRLLSSIRHLCEARRGSEKTGSDNRYR